MGIYKSCKDQLAETKENIKILEAENNFHERILIPKLNRQIDAQEELIGMLTKQKQELQKTIDTLRGLNEDQAKMIENLKSSYEFVNAQWSAAMRKIQDLETELKNCK
jgi:chromosome segregation ATPase